MTKEQIINSPWYITRDCTNDGLCDDHSCDECVFEDTGYEGCVHCCFDICMWKSK